MPKNSINIFIRIESNYVVVLKMDLEADNIWILLVNVEMENLPYSIRRRDIATLYPPFDLITSIVLQCSKVWSLLNVLESILECPKRDCALHVDMAIKFAAKK